MVEPRSNSISGKDQQFKDSVLWENAIELSDKYDVFILLRTI